MLITTVYIKEDIEKLDLSSGSTLFLNEDGLYTYSKVSKEVSENCLSESKEEIIISEDYIQKYMDENKMVKIKINIEDED